MSTAKQMKISEPRTGTRRRPTQPRRSPANSTPKQRSVTPLGALLRVTHEALTQANLQCLSGQGIELTEQELSVMRYPGPHGVRPIDLARRCGITKQAMNYILSGLETKGYLGRKAAEGRRARTIVLTTEGLKLLAAFRKCAGDTERVWAEHIGTPRFEAVRASLHELAAWLGKLEAPTSATA
jgi:DNA-binding MarR family transcriptional regulator